MNAYFDYPIGLSNYPNNEDVAWQFYSCPAAVSSRRFKPFDLVCFVNEHCSNDSLIAGTLSRYSTWRMTMTCCRFSTLRPTRLELSWRSMARTLRLILVRSRSIRRAALGCSSTRTTQSHELVSPSPTRTCQFCTTGVVAAALERQHPFAEPAKVPGTIRV